MAISCSHDVIFGIRIMVHVQTEEVLAGLADHVGVNGAELSVRAGIAEIKGELSGLDLDRHGVRWGGVKYTFAQAFTPKTPSARTSAPTSRTAAHTMALAPPGNS